MIKYKRIYPLRQNGRLAAIVTASGGNDFADISVKFKAKPKEDGLYLVFFSPKTYEYEILPLKEKMCLNRSLTDLTACAVISKNGMLVDILMSGTIGRANISESKLKSIIAMDSYSPCNKIETPQEDNAELLDYLKEMESEAPLSAVVEQSDDDSAESSTVSAEADFVQRDESKSAAEPSVISDIKEADFAENAADSSALKYHKLINPFKERWNGLWWQVKYPDKDWHYIVGRIRIDGDNLSVLGVPGDKNKKPVCMEDCDMYAIADNGIGYWLIFQKN